MSQLVNSIRESTLYSTSQMMILNSALLRIACLTKLDALKHILVMNSLWITTFHSAFSPNRTSLMVRLTTSVWLAQIKIRLCSPTSLSINWIATQKDLSFVQTFQVQQRTRPAHAMVVSSQFHLRTWSVHHLLQPIDQSTSRKTLWIILSILMRRSVLSLDVNFYSQIVKHLLS